MGDATEFSSFLFHISQQLRSDDLEYLMFLCQYEVPAARMEQVTSAMDLFNELRERGKLSAENLQFLVVILTSIDRQNLLEIPHELTKSKTPVHKEHEAGVQPGKTVEYQFVDCLVGVAQKLTSSEFRELRFILKSNLDGISDDRVSSVTQLFRLLQKRLLLTPDNTHLLQAALCQLGLLELVEQINEFLTSTNKEPYPIRQQAGLGQGNQCKDDPLKMEQAPSNMTALSDHQRTEQSPCAVSSSPLLNSGACALDITPWSSGASVCADVAQKQVMVSKTLEELEEEFFELVKFAEETLRTNGVELETVTRRLSMLPTSIKRQHQKDKKYSEIRQRALCANSMKELFDSLTDLKYWNYMTPNILTHILRDVEIVHLHTKIKTYESKLMTFKTNTKLRDVIGREFPVPDHCLELSMEVEGWEDKTIDEAEKSVMNMLRRATYGGRLDMNIRLKGMFPGSIKLVFALTEAVELSKEKLPEFCKANRITNIKIDGIDVYKQEVYAEEHTTTSKGAGDGSEAEGSGTLAPWYSTGSLEYGIQGGRDVLIIESDLTLPPHPEAVTRRAGRLMEGDKQKLKSQGVSSDDLDEASIIKARYECDKRRTLFRVVKNEPESPLLREQVIENIVELFQSTKNDGAIVYYIGAGRRNTGDWCFKDGFITFKDITELYLRLIRGRVLTIVSDCSYSGCWVRACMEFLDEQGVQPCGHKAREKGVLIKVYASCFPTQVPRQYQFSVHGAANDKNSGEMYSYTSKQLSDTQHTYSVNSSIVRCSDSKIEDACVLRSDFTWQKWRTKERISLVVDDSHGRPSWQYVLLDGDEAKVQEFKNMSEKGEPLDATKYGRILESGWGKEPPNEVKDSIERKYGTHYK